MRIKKEDIFFVLFSVITAIVFASYRCMNGDFVAYNGDFQNYNIFRRLMAGQTQYKDFVNYLGSGMVFTNFPCNSLGISDSIFCVNSGHRICISFPNVAPHSRQAAVWFSPHFH